MYRYIDTDADIARMHTRLEIKNKYKIEEKE